MKLLRMGDLVLAGKRVLIREDLNVPVRDGVITSDARIRAALPTLRAALSQGARVIILSHLGRPREGGADPALSLQPVAIRLSELLGRTVPLRTAWLDGVDCAPGSAVLCENVRFNQGEKENDETLARRMAGLCDVFVMDAFATAHRAEASTEGIARFAPIACAGPLLVAELEALERALTRPARPLVAIVGGAKASTKIDMLAALLDEVDVLVLGGAIANTFLLAAGYQVGRSLCEPSVRDKAWGLLQRAHSRGREIVLPSDVTVVHQLQATAQGRGVWLSQVRSDDMIVDIGPASVGAIERILAPAKTIIWNGPLGAFEIDQFGQGTKAVAEAIANGSAYSLAGGGETLAAIEKYGVAGRISYLSTGGGAFLEFVEGKTLPAIAILERRARA